MAADPPFWACLPAQEVLENYIETTKNDPSSIDMLDRSATVRWYETGFRVNEYPGHYLKRVPSENRKPLRLSITRSGFAPDLFTVSFDFVSRKFREVAQLTDDEVQYIDVICDPCTPEAKAQDYKMLWVLGREDVLDMEKSIIHPIDAPANLQWRIDNPERFVYRKNVQTKSQIFHDKNSWFLYVTDELAQRLLDGGIDVDFLDYTTITDNMPRRKTRPGP